MAHSTSREFRPSHEKKPPASTSVELFAQLGMVRRGQSGLINQIKRGFPVSVIDKIITELDISQGELLEIISLPSATLTRRRSEKRLNPKESDRIYRVARVYRSVLQLFEGDKEAARSWLREPAKAFSGDTPLHHLNTEAGADEVQDLIGRLEHGVIA
ncbi:MAG: DUF2384 domain-containing protein [Gammaproteobacteria bacterium]|nr:DUF2384 domain-containing protein [Gammaproteobacteria bacterium]MCF6260320.1 DUF2384 domain-containing protein [Gammaproteobacteria bacterium]